MVYGRLEIHVESSQLRVVVSVALRFYVIVT